MRDRKLDFETSNYTVIESGYINYINKIIANTKTLLLLLISISLSIAFVFRPYKIHLLFLGISLCATISEIILYIFDNFILDRGLKKMKDKIKKYTSNG